ncbi:MAG TPA: glycoside hydrolase family 16 protein [Candidatus Saccharimonadales bacterium]|nr:glycoside hydrolase family 16 protein [Candidatus Saccharimonadales bacterium]
MVKVSQVQAVCIIVFFVLLLGIVSLYVSISAPKHSTAQQSNRQTAKLIFSDDFNGLALNPSKWTTCYDWAASTATGCTNFGNDESEWYLPQQVRVANGSLQLQALKQDTPGTDKLGYAKTYPYMSGMVSTGKRSPNTPAKWVNTYGYYEARMNAPAGKAIWPAFWLLPQGTEWPPEIDIMELLGDKPDQLLHTYFWKDTQGQQAKDSLTYTAPSDLTNEWHTYALDWQPNKITWYLDGRQVRNITSPNVPNKKMEILLNLAVGGRLPGSPDETTPTLSTLRVDYVRVYDKKP